MKKYRRTRRGYDGINTVAKHINKILPSTIFEIEETYNKQPNKVIEYWPEVIGEKLAAMTEAEKLVRGVLIVKVKSSTLYSLLCQYEKLKLLHILQKKFSKETVSDIRFVIK
jgi:hypothetical protein